MRWHRWRLPLGLFAVGVWVPAVAVAQVSGIGRAQWPSAVRASVPAVAVLSANATPDGATDARGRRRWRAVLRTGANDRHAVHVRGLPEGWTVRVAGDDPAVPRASATGAGELRIAEQLARGYHELVLWIDGPARQAPTIEAIVQTTQVPGGLAVATLALTPADGNLRRP